MRPLTLIVTLSVLLLILWPPGHSAKKKSKKNDKLLVDPKTLKCLVCQSMVEEFQAAIGKVDPKKRIDTGSFRMDGKGEQKRSTVRLARSEVHLLELTEKVCDSFDNYIQGKFRSTGKATVMRQVTHEGNVNPRITELELVMQSEELKTQMKADCQAILETNEEDFVQLLGDESLSDKDIKQDVCVKRSQICKKLKRDEL